MKHEAYQSPHTILVNRKRIELTHCEKILFPQDHITKGELIDYYHAIAPHMLPYITDHPLMLQRFVNGITEEGFYQKDAGSYFPDWIKLKKIARHTDGAVNYVIANNTATLIYLTNQVTISYHSWLSTIDNLHKPDRIVFDLDPSGRATFADVAAVARVLHDYFKTKRITPLLMTTGSRGLHVIIPLKQQHDFDTVRSVARAIAHQCAEQLPTKITLEARINNRGNKIYIDILRNAFAQTSVAAYSVRARPHAPVATPIGWQELFDKKIKKSNQFTIKTIFKRLAHTNPWHTLPRSLSLERLEP